MEYVDPSKPATIVRRLEMISEYIEKRMYDRTDTMNVISEAEINLFDFDALIGIERYAGLDKPLFLYRKAISKGKYQGALHHLRAIQKIAKHRKNDTPFKVGDKVWIDRTEHGWDVGEGIVDVAKKNERGIWQYEVKPIERDVKGKITYMDYTYFIAHTRDLTGSYF